ncbi:hypothetical protein GCM10023322_10170 [Rugosimonospora acidiphila]|uniref:Uncharacterized protein n=1 Tax=Rugosimonospora acidiphila TaxID=556531 RepID=A0ABP9RKP7_9ACTN
MKVHKAFRGRRRWATVLVAGALAGAAVVTQSQAASAASKVPVFSAAQLSDALMFKDGPAAPYLASLQRDPVKWTDAQRQAERTLDAAISKDPKWSASFAARIQSGDPNQVRSALNDLAVMARGVLDKLFGPDAIDRAASLLHDGIGNELVENFDNFIVTRTDLDQAFAVIADQSRDGGEDNIAVYQSNNAIAVERSTAFIWSESIVMLINRVPTVDDPVYQEMSMLQELLVRTITQSLELPAAG